MKRFPMRWRTWSARSPRQGQELTTKTGTTEYDGAVAQVNVTDLIASAFDRRAGDPHLHTHVVIRNKARTVLHGRWRARPLDG